MTKDHELGLTDGAPLGEFGSLISPPEDSLA